MDGWNLPECSPLSYYQNFYPDECSRLQDDNVPSNYVNAYAMATDVLDSTFNHLHQSSNWGNIIWKNVQFQRLVKSLPRHPGTLLVAQRLIKVLLFFVTCLYIDVNRHKDFNVKLISLLNIRVCIPEVIVFLVWDLCTEGVNKICFKQRMTALWGRKTAQLQHAARPEEVTQCETPDWQRFKSKCHERDLRLSGYSDNRNTQPDPPLHSPFLITQSKSFLPKSLCIMDHLVLP